MLEKEILEELKELNKKMSALVKVMEKKQSDMFQTHSFPQMTPMNPLMMDSGIKAPGVPQFSDFDPINFKKQITEKINNAKEEANKKLLEAKEKHTDFQSGKG